MSLKSGVVAQRCDRDGLGVGKMDYVGKSSFSKNVEEDYARGIYAIHCKTNMEAVRLNFALKYCCSKYVVISSHITEKDCVLDEVVNQTLDVWIEGKSKYFKSGALQHKDVWASVRDEYIQIARCVIRGVLFLHDKGYYFGADVDKVALQEKEATVEENGAEETGTKETIAKLMSAHLCPDKDYDKKLRADLRIVRTMLLKALLWAYPDVNLESRTKCLQHLENLGVPNDVQEFFVDLFDTKKLNQAEPHFLLEHVFFWNGGEIYSHIKKLHKIMRTREKSLSFMEVLNDHMKNENMNWKIELIKYRSEEGVVLRRMEIDRKYGPDVDISTDVLYTNYLLFSDMVQYFINFVKHIDDGYPPNEKEYVPMRAIRANKVMGNAILRIRKLLFLGYDDLNADGYMKSPQFVKDLKELAKVGRRGSAC